MWIIHMSFPACLLPPSFRKQKKNSIPDIMLAAMIFYMCFSSRLLDARSHLNVSPTPVFGAWYIWGRLSFLFLPTLISTAKLSPALLLFFCFLHSFPCGFQSSIHLHNPFSVPPEKCSNSVQATLMSVFVLDFGPSDT